jgi:hypothetical protein
MSTSQALLFVIVGRNEPLFETEIHKRGTVATSASDAMARQNYFVLHSALDLVDKAAWTSSNMYLKVVDKVHISITFYTKYHAQKSTTYLRRDTLSFRNEIYNRSINNRYHVS